MKITRLFYTIFCLLTGFSAFSQTFTGPGEVCYNVNQTYSYSDDVVYSTVSWSVTGGGTIVSGTGLSRVIKWTSDGSVTVTLRNSSNVIVSQGTKYVYVYKTGTISAPSEVCSGNSVTINSSGYYGTSFNWQYSTDGSTWSALTTAGPSIIHTPATTTWYRSYVCATKPIVNISNVITVSLSPQTVAGTLNITSPSSFCSAGTASFSLSGYTGTVTNWYVRYLDAGGSWSSWSGYSTANASTNSYAVNAGTTQTRTYEFYTTVKSGVCSAFNTNTVTVTVYPNTNAGTLSVISQFCGASTANLSHSGYVGTINAYQVRSKIGPSGSWSSWSNTSNTPTVSPSGADYVTYEFQALVQSGICSQLSSNIPSTIVYPNTSIGSLSPGASSFCSSGTVNLSLTSYLGSLQWQYRSKDGTGGAWTGWATFSSVSSLTNNYNVTSGTGIERYYEFQVLAQSGSCSQLASNIVPVTVYQLPVSGTMGSILASYCLSGTVNLSVTGNQGFSGYFQKREKIGTGAFGSWATCSGSVAVSSSGSDTRTYEFQWVSTSPGCTSATTTAVSTIVYPNTSVGALSPDGYSFCSSATLNLSLISYVGSLQWQYRWKDGTGGTYTSWATFSTASSLGNSINITSGTGIERRYEFQVFAQSGSCAQLQSNIVTDIIVYPTPAIGNLNISPGTSFYASSPELNFSVSSATGSVTYESSVNGSTWSVNAKSNTRYKSIYHVQG